MKTTKATIVLHFNIDFDIDIEKDKDKENDNDKLHKTCHDRYHNNLWIFVSMSYRMPSNKEWHWTAIAILVMLQQLYITSSGFSVLYNALFFHAKQLKAQKMCAEIFVPNVTVYDEQ